MFKKKKDQTYQSYWSISWNIFKKNKVAMVCLFIVILLCLIALFAPLIAPYDPNKQVLTDRLMKPCGQHWFGTDDLGRDFLKNYLWMPCFFKCWYHFTNYRDSYWLYNGCLCRILWWKSRFCYFIFNSSIFIFSILIICDGNHVCFRTRFN